MTLNNTPLGRLLLKAADAAGARTLLGFGALSSGTLPAMADDTATSIVVPGSGNRGATILLTGFSTSLGGVLVWGRVNSSQQSRIIVNNAAVTFASVNNTVLAGTTGADAAFTISTSDQSFYFENRIGVSLTPTYLMLVGQV